MYSLLSLGVKMRLQKASEHLRQRFIVGVTGFLDQRDENIWKHLGGVDASRLDVFLGFEQKASFVSQSPVAYCV